MISYARIPLQRVSVSRVQRIPIPYTTLDEALVPAGTFFTGHGQNYLQNKQFYVCSGLAGEKSLLPIAVIIGC